MGGRGTGFGRGNSFFVQEVTGSDGGTIDLSEFPLQYGSADPVLNGVARSTLAVFENQRYKNKIEFSQFIDANGSIIETNKGGKGSVRHSFYAARTASYMSHNHPRTGNEAGFLGGTFSEADLDCFVRNAQLVYRATAMEGVYSISKTASFNASGFKSYFKSEQSKNTAIRKMAQAKLKQDYHDAKITYKQLRDGWTKEFNRYLVAEHNSLLKGAKTYGYNYTLEERRHT